MNGLSTLKQRTFTGLALIAIFMTAYMWLSPIILSLLLMTALGFILFKEWPCVGIPALTPWYPILPFIFLIVLNHSVSYRPLLPAIFIITAGFDVGSYFVGSLFGRRRLAPILSPGKTWEGVLGGFFCSLICATLFFPALRAHHTFFSWVGLVASIDFAALLGDLFVSYLKRRVGVKDCGALLPGHGGLLDRFDSILFVTYVLFFFRGYI